jgi:hypothetical protein
MKEILFSFFSDIGQKLVVLMLIGTTALTTGSAVSKLVANPSRANEISKFEQERQIPNLTEENSVLGASTDFTSGGATPSPTKVNPNQKITLKILPTVIPTAKPSPKPSVIPTAIPTAKKNPVLASNISARCIITLFGKQYDVTQLRVTHSGGDIFKCGTDMTTTYQNQHGTNMNRMANYLYTGTASTPTPSGINRPESDRDRDEESERNDDRHSSRYTDDRDRENNSN